MLRNVTTFLRVTPMIALDAGFALFCFLAAYSVRYNDAQIPSLEELRTIELFQPYRDVFLMAPFVRVFCYNLFGLYEIRPRHSAEATSTLVSICKAVTLGSAILIIFAFLYRGAFTFREFSYSRSIFMMDWFFNLAAVVAVHAVMGLTTRFTRRRGLGLRHIAVQGSDAAAFHMMSELSRAPEIGYQMVGYIAESPVDTLPSELAAPQKYLGRPENILDIVSSNGLDELVVTNTHTLGMDFLKFIEKCHSRGVVVKMALNFYEFLAHSRELEELAGVPVIQVNEITLEGPARVLKRMEDVVIAGFLLFITAPMWAALAILIKRESPGPVFFNQNRVGKNGRIFKMYKFRSMVHDADERKKELEALNDATGHIFKMKKDPRVTWIGGLMRRSGVDELPQLINVLRGEMSIVGPRPLLPEEVERHDEHQKRRLATTPGITGLWQVNRSQIYNFDEVVNWDLYYIENWSFWLDLKILMKTASAVVQGKAE